MSAACRVSSDLAQFFAPSDKADVRADVLLQECADAVDREPMDELFMRLATGTTHEARQAAALELMGEMLNKIFDRNARDIPAHVVGCKAWLRDQLAGAHSRSNFPRTEIPA